MHGKTLPDVPSRGKLLRRLYPASEARELLGGLSKSAFERLEKAGQLNVIRQGRRVYVAHDEIDRYIENLRGAACESTAA